MSTVVNFNGKNIVEPGAYAETKANVNVNPVPFSTGNVLIIDDGPGVGFGGGSGIIGTLGSGLESVYTFTSLSEFRSFVRGGKLWDLAEYLFIPENGAAGAPQVTIVKAATTTPSFITYPFTSGANGGNIKINCKNEGLVGATADSDESLSVLTPDTKVRTGWGSLMKTGVIDNTKYYMEFYEGTFKGLDADGDPYDGLDILSCEPNIIARSPEFDNATDLIAWMKTDTSFNARFVVDASTAVIGTGVLVAGDYTANDDLKLAAGGTTVYGSTDFDEVLAKISEVDYTFILSLNNGDTAQGANNTKLLYHITQEAEFKKFMVLGGGNDSTAFKGTTYGSVETAQYFNSAYAIVCHSGFKVNVPFSAEKKLKSSLYHAAMVCGRLGGLAPQTSATFKSLRAKMWRHILTPSQRVIALQAGVLHNRYVEGSGYVINQAINSIQKNTQMINPDATSNEISIMRIAEQLNKEMVLNSRPLFTGQNLNTASPADVKAFVEGYLKDKTASKIFDNLIIRFSGVSVTQTQDCFYVKYNFVTNSPVNKLFITGFMLDANLSA